MVEQITEKDGVHKQWPENAKKLRTLEDFDAFFRHLMEDYQHDYGTVCHALSAIAVAAATVADRQPTGGISGFQAGCVLWGFIQQWSNPGNDGPMRLVCYDNLLYPQYADKFENTISQDTWDWLQEQAQAKLAEGSSACDTVREHWQSIIDGVVPFGFVVRGS